ncbi:MAG: glycolate oxidase subunit GlcE [Sinobacteraceae bacterium]|nr:glycolate oxidase subunit GlcE [Nevskiaceae bacterium]
MRPGSENEVLELVREAMARSRRLELRGGGSKRQIGAPLDNVDEIDVLELTGLHGIVDYDPSELVLTVRAGTLWAEVERALATERQMLACEPLDVAATLGDAAGRMTVGGLVASGLSGPRRVVAGSVRDHVLGFRAVSGRGELFVGGGKVVKNVTGYDLPKLLTGSWGRLAALTEVTLKVLPAPEVARVFALKGLDAPLAWQCLARVLGSSVGATAAMHFGPGTVGAESLTVLRLEGFAASVAARLQALQALIGARHELHALSEAEAVGLWGSLASLDVLPPDRPIWRLSVPARQAPSLLARCAAVGDRWLFDWGGALCWLASDVDPERLRTEVAAVGGHAMLWRADAALRRRVPTFHPLPAGLGTLEDRVRRQFDPLGVFATARFAGGAHAH